MKLRVALAQINPTVGDLAGNAALITKYTDEAVAASADVIVFPEMVLTGYPVEDLALRASCEVPGYMANPTRTSMGVLEVGFTYEVARSTRTDQPNSW